MGSYVFFVSPGIGPGDAAVAKARYEGEDPAFDGMASDHIQGVADELARLHGLTEDSSGDDGIDLEEERENSGLDVHLDRWGVSVQVYAGESDAESADNLKRGRATALTASRLLEGAVYDAERDRIVDAGREDAEITRAAVAAFARQDEVGVASKRSLAPVLLFLLIPTIGFTLVRWYIRGVAGFLLMFGSMAATGVFLAWWARRPTGPARPAAPSMPGPRDFERAEPGGKPIQPS